MSPLRWGIASAGKISNDFCAALSTLPAEDHKVVAVAARSLADAKKFAEKFQIPTFYEGYQKLAEDPNVDVVYIGSLNHTHLDIGILMLDGGKHILCEKPLTLNEKQSKKLLTYAKAKNLICVEAIWSRFFPSYKFLQQRIVNGDLGDIKEVDVSFGFNLQGIERVVTRNLGGGTILDLGVYTIQVSLFAFQTEPISIKATGKLNKNGVDVETKIELKFPNGGVAHIRTSALEELENVAVIKGSKGSMKLHKFWCPVQVTDIDGTLRKFSLPNHRLGDFVFHNSAGLNYEAQAMKSLIASGKLESDVVPHSESLLIAHIQDEIRRQIGVVFDED